jgi:hypothetical protein
MKLQQPPAPPGVFHFILIDFNKQPTAFQMTKENPSPNGSPLKLRNKPTKPAAGNTKRTTKATKTTKKKTTQPSAKAKRVERPFPRVELREAVKVPLALRHKNGGNPWLPDLVAAAVGYGKGTNSFYYLTAASRDFGLTEGTRDSDLISLTELGRRLAYPETPEQEAETRREAFRRIELFRNVLQYYDGKTNLDWIHRYTMSLPIFSVKIANTSESKKAFQLVGMKRRPSVQRPHLSHQP